MESSLLVKMEEHRLGALKTNGPENYSTLRIRAQQAVRGE
jgi:hypothetical protein